MRGGLGWASVIGELSMERTGKSKSNSKVGRLPPRGSPLLILIGCFTVGGGVRDMTGLFGFLYLLRFLGFQGDEGSMGLAFNPFPVYLVHGAPR